MTMSITLWLFNIAMENDPFIDGLPNLNMVIFHGELLNNQMVTVETTMLTPRDPPKKNRSVPGVSDLLRDRSKRCCCVPKAGDLKGTKT